LRSQFKLDKSIQSPQKPFIFLVNISLPYLEICHRIPPLPYFCATL
jgi:hypothetical protein